MYKLLTIATLFVYSGLFAQRTTLPNTANQSPSNFNLKNLNGQQIQGRIVVNDSAWLNGAQNLFPNGQVGIGTVTPRFKLHATTNDANGFYAKARVILGKRAWIGVNDSLNPYLPFPIFGAGMFYSRNNNTEQFFMKTANDSLVGGEETAAMGYINLSTGAETFLECHEDHIHASVLTTDIGDTVVYVGFQIEDPDGMIIAGKAATAANYALRVQTGVVTGFGSGENLVAIRNDGLFTVGNAAGTTYAEIRANGRIALGSELASTDNLVLVGESGNKRILVYSDSNGIGIEGDSNFIVISSDSIILGRKYGASGVTSAIVRAEASSGSNQSGGTLYFKGAAATGNSTSGGYIQFGTSDAGASGATQQPISEKVRITKTGDVVIFPSTKGVVMFDGTNYWRLTNTAGVASFTDIGTTIPD